jgi:hypothetical protein
MDLNKKWCLLLPQSSGNWCGCHPYGGCKWGPSGRKADVVGEGGSGHHQQCAEQHCATPPLHKPPISPFSDNCLHDLAIVMLWLDLGLASLPCLLMLCGSCFPEFFLLQIGQFWCGLQFWSLGYGFVQWRLDDWKQSYALHVAKDAAFPTHIAI